MLATVCSCESVTVTVVLLLAVDEQSEDAAERCESPMNDVADVNRPNVATTVISIQHHIHDMSHEQQQQQQQQQRGKWHHQGAVVNGRRRNVYRTNSRRRYDLTPAVRRCVVTDKSAALPDDTDTAPHHHQQTQQPTTLFSRRNVINLDPLTPRPAAEQVRAGRGNVPPATAAAAGGKVRWQRQQTTYQLTPRALRTARTDVSAGARLTTRRERTMTDDNLLSATGKKLLSDGSATARNGETCRVIELKLNTHAQQTPAETSRRGAHVQRSGAASDSTEHSQASAPAPPTGVVLPQLSTHR